MLADTLTQFTTSTHCYVISTTLPVLGDYYKKLNPQFFTNINMKLIILGLIPVNKQNWLM